MNLTAMIEAGTTNPLLLFAIALVIGGLHGLEPGHSKTMIAAYILAIRGTVAQAVLLGVSAAVSHSIIVWILAILALTYGDALIGEKLEPYLIIASGIIILILAFWMLSQTLTVRRARKLVHAHSHDHAHHHHSHMDSDAHARAHAKDIEERVAAGNISNWQTIMFGLSGGLIPCPAAITVFLLCLQLDKFYLGITLVSAFSIGLALTLVLIGSFAAIGINQLSKRMKSLDKVFDLAPYLSSAIIAIIGILMIYFGFDHLSHI